jgi:hypothetical protein
MNNYISFARVWYNSLILFQSFSMKKKISDIIKYLKLEKLKNDKQIVAFMVCLLIATVLWFLNALSKDYTATVSYPVKYVNPPSNRFLSNAPPAKFDLKVEAHGFTLLRHKLSLSFSPIVLNLSAITRNVESDSGTYTIRTENLLRRISDQVSKEISISEIRPEFITLILDSLITKKVPVKLNIKAEFKPQFYLQEPLSASPDSVKITGPTAILDTVFSLKTEPKTFERLDAQTERQVDLLHPEKTTISPEKVMIRIPVERFTEKELKIPVEVRNKPEGVNIKLFPSDVKVSFLVGLNEFENITAADFKAFVDYETIIKSKSEELDVKIDTQPTFIQMLRISPATLEYHIETD